MVRWLPSRIEAHSVRASRSAVGEKDLHARHPLHTVASGTLQEKWVAVSDLLRGGPK